MTISNKYNAGFCVLTIKVVGYAHVIWITKKMVENVFSIDFREWMVVKSRSVYANDIDHCIHESVVEVGQGRRQIESGAANKV
jgi:hypothetical protein